MTKVKFLQKLLLEYGKQIQHDCMCDFLVNKLEGLQNDESRNKGVPKKASSLEAIQRCFI